MRGSSPGHSTRGCSWRREAHPRLSMTRPRRRSIAVAGALLLAALACGRDRGTHALRAVVDGVALDSRTSLEWTSRGDESLPWPAADGYCRALSRAGRKDWRLPEIEELKALYDVRFDEPCGDRRCHLDPAIGLPEPFVWSTSTPRPGTRFYFDFATGTSLSPDLRSTLVRRVLCVRQASP